MIQADVPTQGAARATELLAALRDIVGRRHVLTDPGASQPYRSGYRYGNGAALAAVLPGSLVELWRVAAACVAHGVIMIPQAANTGLTGGSTPFGDYDRPVIVISTRRIAYVGSIRGGTEAICFAGATLTALERLLAPIGRTPHSVIGSSCIGASVVGGICNNSGGALVRRGPAFTTMALYARINEAGELVLVDELGLAITGPSEAILDRLDRGPIDDSMFDPARDSAVCDTDYETHVRQIDDPTPARFNADTRRLHGASGSAGRIIVFAVRVGTFPATTREHTFLIGTHSPDQLTRLRRDLLGGQGELPIAAEYMHADVRDLATSHGRDMCFAIRALGPARIPAMFAVKRAIDRLARPRAPNERAPSEYIAQALGWFAPDPLPSRLRKFARRFDHLLILKMQDNGIDQARTLLETSGVEVVECSPAESEAIFRLRFAAAGAAVRFVAVNRGSGPLVAFDVALPRSERDWNFALPGSLKRHVRLDLRYGHFLCQVFHLDFVLHPGSDPVSFEHAVQAWLAERGARCPAEHNVGHLYAAPAEQVAFYRTLDPLNLCNPGIGQTSRRRGWA